MKTIAAFFLVCLLSLPAAAVEDGQVSYVGGTVAGLQARTVGRLDTSSETSLTFDYANGKFVILYAKLDSFEYSEEVARHLGVLPAIAVGLVKRRQKRHYFRLSYRDEGGGSEVAIFEVSKHMPRTLWAILQTRAPKACKPGFQFSCRPAFGSNMPASAPVYAPFAPGRIPPSGPRPSAAGEPKGYPCCTAPAPVAGPRSR